MLSESNIFINPELAPCYVVNTFYKLYVEYTTIIGYMSAVNWLYVMLHDSFQTQGEPIGDVHYRLRFMFCFDFKIVTVDFSQK